MPNQRERTLVLQEQGMSNGDIARKLGVAPPNARIMANKRFQELGDTGPFKNWQKSIHHLFKMVVPITAEKIFTMHQTSQQWSDRQKLVRASAIVEQRQNPKSVTVWALICSTCKTPLVFVDAELNIDQSVYRRFILDAVVVSLARRHFDRQQWCTSNKILLQPIERKRRRRGVRPIFPTSSHLRNGVATRRISILWITAFGQFWRREPVLSPTKVWRLWSSRCSRGGTDCPDLYFRKPLTLCIEAEGGQFETNQISYSENCSLLLSYGNIFLCR